MGYSHYVAYRPHSSQWAHSWAGLVGDAERMISVAGIAIAGGGGEGEPELSDEVICLNGVGDQMGETFILHGPGPAAGRAIADQSGWLPGAAPDRLWSCVKTAREPYDLIVSAITLRAAQLAPDEFVFASDGDWDEEWVAGADLPEDVRPPRGPRALVEDLFGSAERPERCAQAEITGLQLGLLWPEPPRTLAPRTGRRRTLL